MTLQFGLTLFLIAFTVVDGLFASAVIYHLRKYSLPGWTGAKIVPPLYVILSLLFLGLAGAALLDIPPVMLTRILAVL